MKRETESIVSAFSVFSSSTDAGNRFQVIKEGYLDVAKPSKTENNMKFSFVSRYCSLTRDGRLILDEGGKKEKMVVQECTVTDACVFRLLAIAEENLPNRVPIDLLCKAKDENDGTEWLIAIETSLRTRLTEFRHELDCARGNLAVLEIAPTCKDIPNMKKARSCRCFYYNKTFRVKGLDGIQTSSFNITNISTDDLNLPLCLIITTPGRTFVCRAEDVDEFKMWHAAIRKDLAKSACHEEILATDELQSEMLVGPTPEKMIRVTSRYMPKDNLFETNDFAGVVDSFNIMRCVIIPPNITVNYNLLLLANLSTDTTENEEIKLFLQCPSNQQEVWKRAFQPDMSKVCSLIDKAIMQIELRRIMKNECGTAKKLKNVLYRDIRYLMSLEPEEQDKELLKPNEWPVGKLERLIQMIMKLLPEPLIPYQLQPEFIELGAEIASEKHPKDLHCKKAQEKVEKLDEIRRDILQKMTIHIFRLTSYYNRRKSITGSAASQNSMATPLSKRGYLASASSHDAIVWFRLSKYMFRFHEQGLDNDTSEKYLSIVSQVIVCFQAWYIEQIKRQAHKSTSKSKRADVDANCRQH